MKHIKCIFISMFILGLTMHGYSQAYKVRIGFVGNSITEGTGLPDKNAQAYPMVAAKLLKQKYGDSCVIYNAGVSGRTLLKRGDYPIWREQQFTDCWQFAPDILYIMLGTNDSKPQNWDSRPDEFFPDYISMVDTFKKRNPRLQLIVVFPPPAYKTSGFSIRDSVIRKHIIPLIDSVRRKYNATLINFYKALKDSDKYFTDNIHPDVAGAAIMGKMVYDTIVKYNMVRKADTTYTYATSLKSNLYLLSNQDSAEITYTTLNAQSATINGKSVPVNGKIKVRASSKTIYKLVAKGKTSSDSLEIAIDFYAPVLTKINVSPGSAKVNKGQEVTMNLTFYDQKTKEIKNPNYNVTWVITRGEGTFKTKTNTSAVFTVAGSDTIHISVKVDTVTSNISKLIVKPATDISEINSGEIKVYPNPSQNIVNFKVNLANPSTVRIKIIDLKGAVKIQENMLVNGGEQILSLKTEGLVSGVYFYEINYAGKSFTGKLNVIK